MKHSRADDIAGRYGAEEFVLILPNANLRDTAARTECLRESLKDVTMTHLGKPLATSGRGAMAAARFNAGPADDAGRRLLYRAKNQGRTSSRRGISFRAGPGVTSESHLEVTG